jgi:NADH-quinone oxidoreductase subunit J
MIFPALFFYLFAGVCVASAFMVIAARNPVHSVLFLILAFVNAAALFVMAGAEFLAMILIVVYVGAASVLFLFVVMMLEVDFVELRQGFLTYRPFAAVLGFVFLVELISVGVVWIISPTTPGALASPIATKSIELILHAVNINFVVFSAFLGDLVGQVFALVVLTVAAAEAAIGLAILVVFFCNRGSIAVEDSNLMKG